MPLKGNLGTSLLDEKEAEVIVNEYFNYIEDIGLSLNLDFSKSMGEGIGIGDIVESITKKLENSMIEGYNFN